MGEVDATHCTVAGAYTLAFPNLGPLQDNGGATLTHAPQSSSPAIDAGSVGGCRGELGAVLTTDQRGLRRVEGHRCDAGSVEAQDRVFRDSFES